ncbi:hypothetical protein Tco_0183540 [Tanacetum coccineum]
MEEINNFQQEPDETLYQAWERFKELLMKCPQHYLTEMQETAADAKKAIQEMAEYSQKWHNGTSRGRSTKTPDGLAAIQAQLNNLGREIKKVNDKVYVAQLRCVQCKRPHHTKDFPLKEEGKTLEEAYYTQSMEDTLSKFMSKSTKRHEENSNLIKEIRARRCCIRNQRASIKTLEIQIGQMSKVLPERGFRSLPSQLKRTQEIKSSRFQPLLKLIHTRYAILDHPNTPYPLDKNNKLLYKSRQMTIPFPSRLDNHYCDEEEGNYGLNFAEAYGASHINDTIPQKEKDPRRFTLPCFINNTCFGNALVDLGATVSVMPLSTYLNLGLGKLAHTRLTLELAVRTVKYPKGIAENVLVGIGKFTFLVDFIILDMPEDIKVPLILGRPFLSTAHDKINVYKRKITLRIGEENIIFKSVKPASSLINRVYMLSLRERIELDLEARLMGETLVLNRSLDPFLEDYIELNDLNKPYELRRNQGDDLMPTIEEGEVIKEFRTRDEDLDTGIDNYLRALMNVPIFVGTFSVVTDFAVLEDMDAYRDEVMGDVSVGEPFLREVGIKAKRFDGMITIYNGNDKVTYQMVRSHMRFKNHINKQCNKIPPLLKVSQKYEKNGISHAYQKLKRFYKGVLNLGPDYIRNAKTEEWLIRGHISMHVME